MQPPAMIEHWLAWVWIKVLLAAPLAGVVAWRLSQRLPPVDAHDPSPAAMASPLSLSGIPGLVKSMWGWQRLVLAFGAGTLSALAMAPFFLSPVLLLTLPILVWLIDGSTASGSTKHGDALRAAMTGWWFGFGYFLAGLYWIGEAFLVEAEVFAWLLPFAVTLMPAGLALFYALAAAAARLAWCSGMTRILILACALAVAEWLRGHILTGFPWNTLGYALTYPLPFMQLAAVLGIHGLTLVAVPMFAAPLLVLTETSREGRRTRWALALAALAVPAGLLWAAGSLMLHRNPTTVDESIRIRIVQPSIPQREKWQSDKQGANFALHLDLSRQAPDGRRDDLAGVTHVVWPEAAMPFLPLERPEAIRAIADLLPRQTYLLTGALRLERPSAGSSASPRIFNSMLVFAPGGGLSALYDKIHLVPFGEYLPLQAILERIGLQQLTRLRGGFATGLMPRPLLSVPGLPSLVPLVCYEAIFPTELIQGEGRPALLVNITNDGWFGNSTGPPQHFHQARVRAAEQGLPLIRAANNGISAVIDAQGRVLAGLALNRRGTIDTSLPRPVRPTIYARYGEGVFAALLVLLLGFLLARRSAARSRGPAGSTQS